MRTRTSTLLAAAAVALGVALSGCAAATPTAHKSPSASPTKVRQETLADRAMTATAGCVDYKTPSVSTGDSGRTVSVKATTADYKGEGVRPEQAECILKALAVPDSVLEHMRTTRQMDGQQTDSWDGISARWTFTAEGPSQGMKITLTQG